MADAFLIAGVREGLLGRYPAVFQKGSQGGVERKHSVLAAYFHQSDKVFHLTATDAGTDSGIVDEDF